MGSFLSSDGKVREKRKEVYKLGDFNPILPTDDFEFLRKGNVREDELIRIPDRRFLNGGSKVAFLYTQEGGKETNQDAMLVWENFCSREDTIFCGVFDGHGKFGHVVAKKVRDSLPLKLWNLWKAIANNRNGMNSVDEWGESFDAEESKKFPDKYLILKQSLLKAFKLMDEELKMHQTNDSFHSGTTAVALIKQGQALVIGNVGDSRAVLGTRDKNNALVAIQLTVDLKPDLPREAARILQSEGSIFSCEDEPGVARVWSPTNSIGLAVSRAFGDFYLKDFGLISVPDISYHHLMEKDEFIILATDGVWDVLSNKEVVDIVASAPSRASAARAIVVCAKREWRLKFPISRSDDCSAVCLFLDPSSPN